MQINRGLENSDCPTSSPSLRLHQINIRSLPPSTKWQTRASPSTKTAATAKKLDSNSSAAPVVNQFGTATATAKKRTGRPTRRLAPAMLKLKPTPTRQKQHQLKNLIGQHHGKNSPELHNPPTTRGSRHGYITDQKKKCSSYSSTLIGCASTTSIRPLAKLTWIPCMVGHRIVAKRPFVDS